MTDVPTSNESDTSKTPAPDGEPAAPKKVGKAPLIIMAAIVIVAGVVAVGYYLRNHDLESTDDAQVDGNAVTVQSKVGGYVTELDVADNQRVKAGQLLFRIDSRDYTVTRDQARAAVVQAQGQQEAAQANFDITRISAPAKLDQAKAQTASAKAGVEFALSDLDRQTSVDHRSTTQQSIDQAKQNVFSARANLANGQAQEKIANVIPQTIAQAKGQLDQAIAQVAQAKAQLASSELSLSDTEVRAPQDGWVTLRNVQLGTYVAAGQSAFSLVSPKFWVTANFKENQLARMKVGQSTRITIEAYPNLHLEGHVDSIQMGTGSRFSAFPAENATGNFIKIVQRVPVKIAIDRGLDPDFPLPLGLSANPTVTLQ